ncbi:MAG TPA: hypothetical protein PKC39_08245 [Ferruginibacter sp.]|nr:hypothetical protein [Ferruginibacter sp.]
MKNQQHNQQQDYIQQQLCLLLNISIDTYRDMLYKYGIAYLMWYLPCDARQRRILEGSQVFWKWFRLQWEMHDEALLLDPDFFNYTIAERRWYWKVLHEPQALANDIKPNDIVLAELTKKTEICNP